MKIHSVDMLLEWAVGDDHRTPVEFIGEAWVTDYLTPEGYNLNVYCYRPESKTHWNVYSISHGGILKIGKIDAKNITTDRARR